MDEDGAGGAKEGAGLTVELSGVVPGDTEMGLAIATFRPRLWPLVDGPSTVDPSEFTFVMDVAPIFFLSLRTFFDPRF